MVPKRDAAGEAKLANPSSKINAREKGWTLEELLSQINYWSTESKQFYLKERITIGRHARMDQRWLAPSGDWIKFNTDGAYFEASKHGGWGFVARDWQGAARGAGAGHITAVASAAQAEAVACVEALQTAADWGVAQVIIETDSSNLVRAYGVRSSP